MLRQCKAMGDCFYGSVTVGERGQIVIPAEARTELGIKPGDKLLVMKHPMHEGIIAAKIDSMMEFLEEFHKDLKTMKTKEEGK